MPLPTLLPRGAVSPPQYEGPLKPTVQQRADHPPWQHKAHHHKAHRHHGGRAAEQRGGDSQNHGAQRPSDANGDVVGKGAISLLQEFIQCSKQFHAPQHRPILQWGFDTRMADFTTLEFRATVAFVLDGVPHHVAGAWHLSKKLAQRDTAERALGFFVGSWGKALLLLEQGGATAAFQHANNVTANACDAKVPHDVKALEEFVGQLVCTRGKDPQWSCKWDDGHCCAIFEVTLLGVPHKFSGAPAQTEEQAYADTAKRVLWYFRCPGFEDYFEPDPAAPAVTAREIPSPPANWASDNSEEDALHVAERKTALMRVQNRLQQAFARQLRPGQSVWEWSYQTDSNDSGWPPLCRATVHIPVANREFTGGWARGQRDAQIDASAYVTAFLDARANGVAGADGRGHGTDGEEGCNPSGRPAE